ncbi:MAG TPA: hypothetical protein VJ843_00310 [Candidatus Saccharimonadales bacterium]|nr:hypothetical protein [Candidatus Saccharimonadales bacterium]
MGLDIKRVLKHKHYLIAVSLLSFGLFLKILPHALHELDWSWWEIPEELGTFLALIASLHLIYELFIKSEAQQQFIRDISGVVEQSLKTFSKALIVRTKAELENSNQNIKLLKDSVDALGGLSVRIDYLKVGEEHDGIEVTEATIYKRAASEIRNARQSIDAFTSYLLEVDSKNADDKHARDDYFNLLLSLCEHHGGSFQYRRLIQLPLNTYLEDTLGDKAETYLSHIRKMRQMDKARQEVHVKSIDRRRPTTYAIIDNKVLLWQINQISLDGEMQIYGMFIVDDPNRVLIQHFRREFNRYWDTEAQPVKLKLA